MSTPSRKMPAALYHGTLKVNARHIINLAKPQIGLLVKRAYGGEHRPFFFATDDPRETVGAMLLHIENRHPRSGQWHNRLDGDQVLARYGAVAIFENPDWSTWKHCPKDAEECDDYSAEPGDWYTPYEVKPTRVVTGKALVHLVKGW